QPTPDPPPDLPVVYKKSITFFRSLYAYVRLLPAYRLQRRLRKMKGLASLRLGCRLVSTPTFRNDEIPIGEFDFYALLRKKKIEPRKYKYFSVTFSMWADVPIVDSDSRLPTTENRFGSIDTPLG
ncbi:autophagy-related protein 13, partial [Endogone sp. FLAS-F59071]